MSKEEKPLITIITPTWNREFFLRKLADSLESQTIKNFEWIVGNDGSIDNTDEFIRSFSKKANFKITYINSSLRIGKAALDNILLDHVKSEYVSWCGSDDFLLPDAIENISKWILQIPNHEKKQYVGIYAQNVDLFNKSQTFHEKNLLKETKHVTWEYVCEFIKGDGTIIERTEILKGKKFLEVDFVISESSFFLDLYKKKKFIFTPVIVKKMNRSAGNSISFGKKLLYCKGSAYCISIVETPEHFDKHSFLKKLKVVTNFWRYSIHGDIDFLEAKKMVKSIDKNIFYLFFYFVGAIICLRDIMLGKIEKTHIEFDKNIKNRKISVELLN
jgi:glycosyltransferase involved in cell wall biosynthesis